MSSFENLWTLLDLVPSLTNENNESSQTSIDNFSDVAVVECAKYPKHGDVHDQNQQSTVAISKIIASLQITERHKDMNVIIK